MKIQKNQKSKKIILVLKDNSIYNGYSFGAEKSANGEVVFNTGMVGYNQALTDPSYFGQILIFTYPLIGNYGTPKNEFDENNLSKYFESEKIHLSGIIVSEYCQKYSHFNASKSLSKFLIQNNIPAIYGIDTRALTKKIRENGTMLGKIIFDNKDIDFYNPDDYDLPKFVSTKKIIKYNSGMNKKKVVLIDCGVKHAIIKNLIRHNLEIIRVPYDYDFVKNKINYDAIFISNGPGDPAKCTKTIEILKKCLKDNKPIFGICLGHQMLALAAGAKTYKLKYGHRSQNQPCIDIETKRCYITSQNHGFAVVDEKSLPDNWQTWFYNANDKTNEGIKHKTKPFMSVQFHPEANPGPNDTNYLFDEFAKLIKGK